MMAEMLAVLHKYLQDEYTDLQKFMHKFFGNGL